MKSVLIRTACLAAAIMASQAALADWLDQPTPASWNRPGRVIPVAPKSAGPIDPRCKDLERPAELKADRRLQQRGWNLFGGYQGGWQVVVIRAGADYDGMCRPRNYQDFVFVRGVFAGTLSPRLMDSRTDGAISRVYLQNGTRLTAEYLRYTASDPLCCPSGTTGVEFEIVSEKPVVRPTSTYSTQSPSQGTK